MDLHEGTRQAGMFTFTFADARERKKLVSYVKEEMQKEEGEVIIEINKTQWSLWEERNL